MPFKRQLQFATVEDTFKEFALASVTFSMRHFDALTEADIFRYILCKWLSRSSSLKESVGKNE